MARFDLPELMDQPWLPRWLRDGITDALRDAGWLFPVFRVVDPVLRDLLELAPSRRLVDLASGGGGPALDSFADLQAMGAATALVLTDLHPNLAAFARACETPGVTHVAHSVDASLVPAELTGVRTLFNSFHHLGPTAARAVLANAAETRQPILVAEVVARSLSGVFVATTVPLVAIPAAVLRGDPVAFALRCTILPLVLLYEGYVSCLRTYSDAELDGLTHGLGDDYSWSRGITRVPWLPVQVRWLAGRPDSVERDSAPREHTSTTPTMQT